MDAQPRLATAASAIARTERTGTRTVRPLEQILFLRAPALRASERGAGTPVAERATGSEAEESDRMSYGNCPRRAWGGWLGAMGLGAAIALLPACLGSLPRPPTGPIPPDAMNEVPYPPPPARVETVPP